MNDAVTPAVGASTVRIGAVSFRLDTVAHGIFATPARRPLMLLPDGAELCMVELDAPYLFLDHRRDPALPARIELWRPLGSAECEVAGLYVLCEALQGRESAPEPHPEACGSTQSEAYMRQQASGQHNSPPAARP